MKLSFSVTSILFCGLQDKGAQNLGNVRFTKRLSQSERLLARVNEELTQYRKSSGDSLHG